MKDIKIPLKNEIRSRAKVLTDEAFRETRNYLDVQYDNKHKNMGKNVKYQKEKELDYNEIMSKTNDIREILNKVTSENYDICCEEILKINYNETLLGNLKVFFLFKIENLIFVKAVTEKNFRSLYVQMCCLVFKNYNKKAYPDSPLMVYIIN